MLFISKFSNFQFWYMNILKFSFIYTKKQRLMKFNLEKENMKSLSNYEHVLWNFDFDFPQRYVINFDFHFKSVCMSVCFITLTSVNYEHVLSKFDFNFHQRDAISMVKGWLCNLKRHSLNFTWDNCNMDISSIDINKRGNLSELFSPLLIEQK